ncbi:hybrid sensor histidine kinase/response regulator [Pannus brasiliensis CCIBt3594]|uniref:histidine kinase n=1 Tax=Pannus brasiliensis CCIBt3594 TaxID=1427578 RepID=A0AAW9QPK8_9CHRO
MPSLTLSLKHFNQPVPTCGSIADSNTLLELVGAHPAGPIVVVDRAGAPIGSIESRFLLTHLLYRQGRQRGETAGTLPTRPIDLNALARPVVPLNAGMSVTEFLETLTGESPLFEPVLVDNRGKFIGRLDTGRLLRFSLGHVLLEDTVNPRPPDRVWRERPIDFLEQLPLPVLLYYDDGEILYRNRQWRERIGDCFRFRAPAGLDRTPVAVGGEELEVPTLSPVPQRLDIPEGDITRVWQFVRVPLSLSIEPSLATPGEVWLIVATDVTEQQQCCHELAVKNADLVHLNRLKDEFLACISHEFKSPLTAVVGLSNLLREQKIGELNPRQSKYADLIYRSGRQLMSLVNDLLDLTRLETGQLKLTPARVRLDRLCQRVRETIAEKYPGRVDRAIVFRSEIEPGIETIVADESRLQQMLVHLLDNAVKFTADGGTFGLKVNRWENWLAFTVSDTGIGIPEESQHLIFQKFQQLESPLTRQFEGTGLGLVLTQKLARAHGGDLSFVSKVGQGSQFTLLLPPHPLAENSDPPGKQRLVLVVNSAPKAIEQFVDRLGELGMKVIIARTGTEAIEKARQLQPRCIFLAPELPLLSGWDVLTLLKSHPRTKDIKVIVTAPASEKQHSEQQGADGFLVPPITSSALQACLNLAAPPQPARERKTSPTLLRLHGSPETAPELSPFQWVWTSQLVQENYRFIEADSLEQAELLASVWEVDAIVLDRSSADDPLAYLRELARSEVLAAIPLVTLDVSVTEAANQIPKLSVFPCLAPPTESRIEQLLQVIATAGAARDRHDR